MEKLSDEELEVFDAVKSIIGQKQAENRQPEHALFLEIVENCRGRPIEYNKIKLSLRGLTANGVLVWGQTVNDTYFKIV